MKDVIPTIVGMVIEALVRELIEKRRK